MHAHSPGKGTKSGPYQGFASSDWLAQEVKKDVEELKHVSRKARSRVDALHTTLSHAQSQVRALQFVLPRLGSSRYLPSRMTIQAVDVIVTRREQKTFELERTALKGEIANVS